MPTNKLLSCAWFLEALAFPQCHTTVIKCIQCGQMYEAAESKPWHLDGDIRTGSYVTLEHVWMNHFSRNSQVAWLH